MRILLGMSGGLDSTYAAKKLIDEGHSVEGAVVLMHAYTEIDASRESAEALGIKLHIIDCRKRFEERVVTNFTDEYKKGRTPNPCVICNSEIKFSALYEFAQNNGFDKIATGHYADILCIDTETGKRYAVSCAADAKKDQTYMLWRLSQNILSKLIFPLYNEHKANVRAAATEAGLTAADREESQEICFIPSGNYKEFVDMRGEPSKEGDFIDEDGNVIGRHKGIVGYTIGQRKGLGISAPTRIFVTEINPERNTITLSKNDKYSDTVNISGMVFSGIAEPPVQSRLRLCVKLRYLAPKIPCEMIYLGCGRARIILETPARAVTPGQSAVLYDKNLLCAGGFID